MSGDTTGFYELLLTLRTLYQYAGSVVADAALLRAEAFTRRLINEDRLPYMILLQVLHDFLYMRRGLMARELVQQGRRSPDHDRLPGYQDCLETIGRLLENDPISEEQIINSLYTLKSVNYQDHHHPGQRAFAKILKTVLVARLDRALDLGCGYGWVGDRLREQGFIGDLTGVDLSHAMLDIIARKACYQHLLEGNFFEILPTLEERFNLVVMLWVSVHLNLAELCRVFQGVGQVLTPAGVFIFDLSIIHDQAECLSGHLGLPRTATRAVEAALREAGFVVRFIEADNVRYYWCRAC